MSEFSEVKKQLTNVKGENKKLKKQLKQVTEKRDALQSHNATLNFKINEFIIIEKIRR